jgi:O-methyltransferase
MNIGPLNRFALRLVYLARFTAWCDKHPCPRFQNRYEMYEYLLGSKDLETAIDYLEFGVCTGTTIAWWIGKNRHPDSRFIGFDAFLGLPEDWQSKYPKGHFSTGGKPPQISDSRCSFQVGWFQDTLPEFVKDFSSGKPMVVHLDADLYSSTLLALVMMAPKLKTGDILIFDEFADYLHEFRAFSDFLSVYQIGYEVVAMVGPGNLVSVEIQKADS